MIHAFGFLIFRSFVNRSRSRLRRLKQPKYLIGALFGGLYFAAYLFQFLWFGDRRGAPGRLTMDDSLVAAIGVAALLIMMASAWIFPHARAALVFSEAEIAFLFPAPISRRMLIHFKLLRSQIAILVSVLLLTLFTGRLLVNSEAWMRMIGWWVILSTLSLHFLGASFARTLLLERGFSNGLRRVVVLLLLSVLVAATVFWARRTLVLPAIEHWNDAGEWRVWARVLMETPPLSFLIHPLQLLLGPYLAATPLAFVKAIGPALAILLLHYLWVIRSNVAFEEASLALSQKFAERMAAARQGRVLEAGPKKRQRTPFRLEPMGIAPVAFLWKNLIQAQAALRVRTILLILFPGAVVLFMVSQSGPRGGTFAGIVSFVLGMLYIWSLLIGPQLVRCDLRQDLVAMDVLKLYPLRGWQVVAGEILAPAAILTAVQWALLLLLAGLMVIPLAADGLSAMPAVWLVVAALVAPGWNALALLIPNAAVLLFPGWFHTRADAPQGIEVTGQRLLLLFGQLAIISLTIVPAGVAFAAGFFLMQVLGADAVAPVAGAGLAAVMLGVEVCLGVWLVGRLFDRFDLAMEQGT